MSDTSLRPTQRVGARIAEARQARGLTQTEFGAKLSRSRSHAAVSDIERGRTQIDIDLLYEVAALLCCPVEWFLTDTTAVPSAPWLSTERYADLLLAERLVVAMRHLLVTDDRDRPQGQEGEQG